MKELLKITDVARIFGLSTWTVKQQVKKGILPVVRITPRSVRFQPEAIEAYIKSHEARAA
jgi:predicted DNA-binding transcriptional regulator AlpA